MRAKRDMAERAAPAVAHSCCALGEALTVDDHEPRLDLDRVAR
jgi:hypothetical protein